MIDIRILGAGDESCLDAWYARRPDDTIFQRSNLARAGMAFASQRYGGVYAAAFDGEDIVGVVAHYWSGFVMPLADAPEDHVRPLLDATIEESGLPVNGVIGQRDQVGACLRSPRLRERPARRADNETLYGLDLDALRVPEALAAGTMSVRPIRADDLPLLTAWRVAYLTEAFNLEADDRTRAEAASEMASSLAEKRGWVAESDGAIRAFSGFNAALPDVVQVGGVYTPPDARSRGLARAVVAGRLLDARAAGAARSVLFTGVDNRPAQRAYEALGYARIGDWAIVRY